MLSRIERSAVRHARGVRGLRTSAAALGKKKEGAYIGYGEYPGGVTLPYTATLSPVQWDKSLGQEGATPLPPVVPVFRSLDDDGKPLSSPDAEAAVAALDQNALLEMYTKMVRVQTMDKIFYEAQRQGRISFYMTCGGEEAAAIGSCAALDATDPIYAQYREQGVLMWRGFSLDDFADQCFSNKGDPAKGRQMPVHYGRADVHVFTISSPLGTQIPQAAGSAYAAKLETRANNGPGKVVMCYFGEGAASEGDFHAGLNFAATTGAPALFFCRNNGYAISTPSAEQYKGDGIAGRGVGYGIATFRVDSSDIFAVHAVTKAARELALSKDCPVLIESMGYREGHHSTSDDSTRYRGADEIEAYRARLNPIVKLRKFLVAQGWWDDEKEDALTQAERRSVLQALAKAEKKEKSPVSDLFEDVYDTKPWHLVEQEAQLAAHIAKHPKHYEIK